MSTSAVLREHSYCARECESDLEVYRNESDQEVNRNESDEGGCSSSHKEGCEKCHVLGLENRRLKQKVQCNV